MSSIHNKSGYFVLLVVSVIPTRASTLTVRNDDQVKVVNITNPMEPPLKLESAAGQLEITKSGEMPIFEFHVLLRGKEIFSDKSDQSLDVVLIHPSVLPSLLVLQISSGGNGCPSTFRIVDLIASHEPLISREIGNCSDVPEISITQNRLFLRFPAIGYAKAQHWIYTPATPQKPGLLKQLRVSAK